MKIYSVSCLTTKNNNGVCFSFTNYDAAAKCREELIADGCYHVSQVW